MRVILLICFLTVGLLVATAEWDCYTSKSKRGEEGTWKEGTCYGSDDSCMITVCCNDDDECHVTESIE